MSHPASGDGSAEMSKGSVMHFEVHPSVLFKLGEDLITDDAQALVELIKNSYDADAQIIRVDIDTKNWYSRSTGELVPAPTEYDKDVVQGRLAIKDDGTGMDIESIQSGWLTVSYSKKRLMKAEGKTTARNRTPLGDKGLGRLGVQRLGKLVSLVSIPANPQPKNKSSHNVNPGTEETSESGSGVASEGSTNHTGVQRNSILIDWSKFTSADTLASVPLDVLSTKIEPAKSSTEVSVLGLHSLSYWEGSGDLDLQKELTSILSPYDSAAGIRIFIKINGSEIDMRREARRVLDAAPTQFRFKYSDGVLKIESWTSHSILRGRNSEDRVAYEQLARPDGGYRFAEWLISSYSAKAREVGAELGDDKSFLRFHKTIELSDAVRSGITFADPGPFSGEISSLNYDQNSESAFDKASDLRQFAEGIAGIRVFRDGFGIRLDEDWLGLSKQQTNATSYYGLRPKNSAGYVNLSAQRNATLEETSSRESFRDTPAWQGFYGLMQQIVTFARNSQEFVRRNWIIYRRSELTPTILEESATPAEITEHINERLDQTVKSKVRATSARRTLETISAAVAELTSSKDDSSRAIWTDPALQRAVDKATADIGSSQRDLVALLDELDGIFSTMAELKGATKLLHEKLDVAEQRISNAWQSVALGLSAELMAHEVDNIAERLRGRSLQNMNYLKSLEPMDSRLLGYAEHVRSSSSELLRQVARMNPSLRFRRDRKNDMEVSKLVDSAIEYHKSRLKKIGISVSVDVLRDFSIRINEGKFTQIIDNLILNSEYWVTRALQHGKIRFGEIAISIDLPRIFIRDNGPGVSPAVQDSLFEAFVTTKPELQGRGLGLFVVSQLLDSEGASIGLNAHLNSNGRPDTFELELHALLSERNGKNFA